MTSSPNVPAGSEPVTSPGRRDAVRSLAGIGAASAALLGLRQVASAHATDISNEPAGPESLAIEAAKKKKAKRGKQGPTGPAGPTGPTGPAGPAATLVRDSVDVAIGDGGTQSGQANCPSGEATGGGAGISNTNCAEIASGPVGNSAWGATGKCPGGQTATMTVTVICLA